MALEDDGRNESASCLEFDHAFVTSRELDRDEAALHTAGLRFPLHRRHAGQGTKNALAVFENGSFELLAAADPRELALPAVQALGLAERIEGVEDACPFGLALRWRGPRPVHSPFPFPTWQYSGPAFPPGVSLEILTPPDRRHEPMCFVVPGVAPHVAALTDSERHQLGAPRRLSAVVFHGPRRSSLSPALAWLEAHSLLQWREADRPALELECDEGRGGHSLEVPLAVPVTLRW